jgi:sec-independent protein translocase protein TatA
MGLDNPLHIAFLVVILLLLFGAKRLPEIGRSLGSGMREFKQSAAPQPAVAPAAAAPAPAAAAPAPAATTPPPAATTPTAEPSQQA